MRVPMLLIYMLSALAACASEERRSLAIVAPPDGTTISSTAPIVFEVITSGLSCCALYVDGSTWQPSSEVTTTGSGMTWMPTTIANGAHTIRIEGEYDLVTYDDTITLVFARP